MDKQSRQRHKDARQSTLDFNFRVPGFTSLFVYSDFIRLYSPSLIGELKTLLLQQLKNTEHIICLNSLVLCIPTWLGCHGDHLDQKPKGKPI